jgi:hypothetical protein
VETSPTMLGAVKCVAFKCENVCCNAMMVIEEGGSGAYRPSLAMQTRNDQVGVPGRSNAEPKSSWMRSFLNGTSPE